MVNLSSKIEWPSGKKMPVQIVGIGPPNGRQVHSELVEEAYKEYCEIFGKTQTLERLQERGGFDIVELATFLYMRIKRLETERLKVSIGMVNKHHFESTNSSSQDNQEKSRK